MRHAAVIALFLAATAMRARAEPDAAPPDSGAPDAAPDDAAAPTTPPAAPTAEVTPTMLTTDPAGDPAIDPMTDPLRTPTAKQRWARKYRWPITLVEHAMVFGPSLLHYWGTPGVQKVDWELKWDWESWKDKLITFDAIVLDTNRFEANSIRHPLPGVLNYQIGRANGFGVAASTLMAFVSSVLWEYFGEYREKPSINDLFANTVSGILVGEPLFQISLLYDRHRTIPRRILAFVVAPFHRLQKEIGISWLPDQRVAIPNRLEMLVGGNLLRYNGSNQSPEGRFGLDLELVHDPDFLRPGEGTTALGLTDWCRIATEVRSGGESGRWFAGARFQSMTTYVGRSSHANDEAGRGRTQILALGGGFDLIDRRLAAEWDSLAAFHVITPRYGAWWRTSYGSLSWDIGASADLAMVQSWARAGIPLIENSSVVLSHGYYYAPGTSVETRLRGRSGRWMAEYESSAYAFWSYDHHSHGGHGDPKDLRDQRWYNSIRIGAQPWPRSSDVHVELYGDINLRRGTSKHEHLERQSAELVLGVALRLAF